MPVRRKKKARAPRFTLQWFGMVVVCGLAIFIVVKKIDDVREMHVAGLGIAFQDKAAVNTLSPTQQRERAAQVEARVEAQVRAAPPQDEPAGESPPADLSGTWTTPDGRATWAVSIERGFFVFREQRSADPGVVTAAGYGGFDGRTWSVQFQTIAGAAGTASLALTDEGMLEGEIVVAGDRFNVQLRR